MGGLLEHHAGRAVELAHDYALGAVDDEGSEWGEERKLTEIDFLLDDVLRSLSRFGRLEDDELECGLQGRGVRHVALDAFGHGVLGLAKRITLVLEREVLVNVGNREQVLEDALESDVLAVLRGRVELQQRLEGAGLDVEEMRHLHPLVELGKRDLLHQFGHGSPTGANSPAPVCREIFADPERSDFKTSVVVRAVGLGFIIVAVRVTARVGRRGRAVSVDPAVLLHFDGCSLLLELGFHGCCLILRHARFHDARRAVNEILRFLESQAGQLAHDLDDLDLLGTGFLERHRELGLLFGHRGRTSTSATAGWSRADWRR